MKNFTKKIIDLAEAIFIRILYSIDDLFSFKSQIMIAWLVLSYFSNFKTVVVICAAITTVLVGWGREIQKPDSNLFVLIKTFFESKK